jgi:hypothetical protein
MDGLVLYDQFCCPLYHIIPYCIILYPNIHPYPNVVFWAPSTFFQKNASPCRNTINFVIWGKIQDPHPQTKPWFGKGNTNLRSSWGHGRCMVWTCWVGSLWLFGDFYIDLHEIHGSPQCRGLERRTQSPSCWWMQSDPKKSKKLEILRVDSFKSTTLCGLFKFIVRCMSLSQTRQSEPKRVMLRTEVAYCS